MRSFIFTIPSRTSNICVSGACTLSLELAEAGDQRCDAPLDRADVEDLGDQRVAGLGAADGHGPGGAVDPVEVDVRDQILLAPDLPREAVVRLEGDHVAGVDLQHRVEVGAERPDHLVARDAVVCHRATVS